MGYSFMRTLRIIVTQLLTLLTLTSCWAIPLPPIIPPSRGPAANRDVISSTLPVQQLWKVRLTKGIVTQRPLLTERFAIITTDRDVIALDIATGEEQWRHPLRGMWIDIPIVRTDNAIFLGQLDGIVTALELDSGKLLWEKDLGHDGVPFFTDLAIAGNNIIASSFRASTVHALAITDGSVQWQRYLPAYLNLFETFDVITYNDQVYVLGKKTYILDAETGKRVTTLSMDLRDTQQHDNLILAELALFDLGNPNSLWQHHRYWPLTSECRGFELPYIVEEDFFVGTTYCGDVELVERNNTDVRWRYTPERYVNLPMAILQDNLYLLLMNGKMQALSLDDGTPQGTLVTDSPLASYAHGAFTSRGITSNGEFLVVTFNEPTILGLGFAPENKAMSE